MDKNTSLYLDFLRFFAAVLVFLEHFSLDRISGSNFNAVGYFGHEGVLVFFVLSGYVIAYVVSKHGANFHEYIINRLARLYSVLLPALILGITLDHIGNYASPNIYESKLAISEPFLRLFFNAFYLQEIWDLHIRYGSNGPLWSLCYEFWYYIIFGVAVFMKNITLKIATIILLLIFVGPKVILLFPIWLLGVYIFNTHKYKPSPSKITYYSLFFGSIVIYYLLSIGGTLDSIANYSSTVAKSYGEIISVHPAHAAEFMRDYTVGILVAINIYASKYLWADLQKTKLFYMPHIFKSSIKQCASMTYTLYLLHFPLLLFFVSIFPYKANNLLHNLLLATTIYILIFLLSRVTELKKNNFKFWIESLIFKSKSYYLKLK